MITRREFFGGMAAMAAKSGYDPKLALQPYVWTQQLKTEKIALADGLERIFSASERAGYKRMELINSFLAPDVRERTAALVRQYNFDIPVVYRGGAFQKPRRPSARWLRSSPRPTPPRPARRLDQYQLQS